MESLGLAKTFSGHPRLPLKLCLGRLLPHHEPSERGGTGGHFSGLLPAGFRSESFPGIEVIIGDPAVKSEVGRVEQGGGIGYFENILDIIFFCSVGEVQDIARQTATSEGMRTRLPTAMAGPVRGNMIGKGFVGRDVHGDLHKHRTCLLNVLKPYWGWTRPDAAFYSPISFSIFSCFVLQSMQRVGDRPCRQALIGDVAAARGANAVGPIIDALNGLPHLGNQLSLPIADTKFKIPVRLQRCPIVGSGIFPCRGSISVTVFSASLSSFIDFLRQHEAEKF